MIARVLEPEAMDSVEEAVEYDLMDHVDVNRRFVADFLASASRMRGVAPDGGYIVDVGAGTARIAIELCRQQPTCSIVGVDLAGEMLAVGRRNVAMAGLAARVSLQRASAVALPLRTASAPYVVSNSLMHHLPDPAAAFADMCRVIAPRGGGRWKAKGNEGELAEGVSDDPRGAPSATSPAFPYEIWSGISGRNASRVDDMKPTGRPKAPTCRLYAYYQQTESIH